jgi:hypothetical protein
MDDNSSSVSGIASFDNQKWADMMEGISFGTIIIAL